MFNHLKTQSPIFMVLAASLALAACGGGSSSSSDEPISSGDDFNGSTGAASITSDEQAAQAAYAATEGVYQSIASSETSGSLPVAATVTQKPLVVELTSRIWDQLQQQSDLLGLPIAITQTVEGDCGGTVILDIPDEQVQGGTTELNGTFTSNYTFNNYCTSFGADSSTYNGGFTVTSTFESGELVAATYNYDDFSFSNTTNGETTQQTLTGTINCSFQGDDFECGFSEDFSGPNGETYRVENARVGQDADGNYEVSARVYDEELGYVDFTSSGINQSCDNGNFAGGSISFTDQDGNEVTVEFRIDCTTCEVTLNDNPTQFLTQPDRTL